MTLLRSASLACLFILAACDKPEASATPEPRASDQPAAETASAAAAEAEIYAVALRPVGPYTVGKPGKVEAVLEAKGGYKCNPEYPYKFKLVEPPQGVSYPEPVAKHIERTDARSVLSIPFAAESAGKKEIAGTFHFSVCDEQACKIEKRKLSIEIEVGES